MGPATPRHAAAMRVRSTGDAAKSVSSAASKLGISASATRTSWTHSTVLLRIVVIASRVLVAPTSPTRKQGGMVMVASRSPAARSERRPRVVPAVAVGDDRIGRGWPPRPAAVAMQGRPVVENGVDDAPRGLDGILAREERRIAIQRIAEEALVGLHLRVFFVMNEELDAGPDHRRPGLFGARAERDRHVPGAEAEAEVVSRRRHGSIENRARRTAQRDTNLGRRHREPFADSNLEWDSLPAPGFDGEAHGGESLDLRVRSHAGFAPIAFVLPAHQCSPGQRANRA